MLEISEWVDPLSIEHFSERSRRRLVRRVNWSFVPAMTRWIGCDSVIIDLLARWLS